jgi:hypothetical protein
VDVPRPRTRRLRRLVQRAYPAERAQLRRLQPYLTGSYPDWPAAATAADVVQKVEELLMMNNILVTEHIGDEFQLERDRAWLREVRDRAHRASNGE